MAMPVSGVATETPATQVPAGHALARVGRAVRSSRKATAGIILLTIFILVALFPGVIAKDSPTADAYPSAPALSRPLTSSAPTHTGKTCSRRWCGEPGTC